MSQVLSKTIRVPDELSKAISRAATEDHRRQYDEINFLIELGLKAREQLREIHAGLTQIDVASLEAKR